MRRQSAEHPRQWIRCFFFRGHKRDRLSRTAAYVVDVDIADFDIFNFVVRNAANGGCDFR